MLPVTVYMSFPPIGLVILLYFQGQRSNQYSKKINDSPQLENKIYVTYTFGEGDNFQYNQHRMRILWDDPSRGEVPINWTSSPLLYDGAPAILGYYQRTASDNDLLVTGPSGVGYFYPDPWPDDHFSEYLKQTFPYLEKNRDDRPLCAEPGRR